MPERHPRHVARAVEHRGRLVYPLRWTRGRRNSSGGVPAPAHQQVEWMTAATRRDSRKRLYSSIAAVVSSTRTSSP